ncbi:MAG: DNA-binding response regulator [Caldilineae bacterium]|nr:MAG: DNA-binding response regulator [Caldilineae bacterium]
MRKIRVLIADDHTLVRAGIVSLLEEYDDIEVVGEAGGGWEAVEKATRLLPDVVLMDIAMSDLGGLEATQEIKARTPQVQVVALTMQDREEYFFAMLKAGALGYVLKECEPEELIAAIRAAHHGEAFLSPAVASALLREYLAPTGQPPPSRYDNLTLREKEVLHLVAEGKTTRQIAAILHLSAKTVEKHRASLMHKLNLHNLPDLIKYAIRKGLISLDDD